MKKSLQLLERLYENDYYTFLTLFMLCSDWQVKKNAKECKIKLKALQHFLLEKECIILE